MARQSHRLHIEILHLDKMSIMLSTATTESPVQNQMQLDIFLPEKVKPLQLNKEKSYLTHLHGLERECIDVAVPT